MRFKVKKDTNGKWYLFDTKANKPWDYVDGTPIYFITFEDALEEANELNIK